MRGPQKSLKNVREELAFRQAPPLRGLVGRRSPRSQPQRTLHPNFLFLPDPNGLGQPVGGSPAAVGGVFENVLERRNGLALNCLGQTQSDRGPETADAPCKLPVQESASAAAPGRSCGSSSPPNPKPFTGILFNAIDL